MDVPPPEAGADRSGDGAGESSDSKDSSGGSNVSEASNVNDSQKGKKAETGTSADADMNGVESSQNENTSVVTRIFQEDDTPEGGEELRKGLSEIENKLAQERAKKNVNELE